MYKLISGPIYRNEGILVLLAFLAFLAFLDFLAF